MARQGYGSVTSLPIRVIKTGPEGEIKNVKQDGVDVGEVVFEGNTCAKGYHKNPEATRTLYAGGMLHSMDKAVQYADGSIQVLGRQEDIISIGNHLIFFLFPSSYKCRGQSADTDFNTNRRNRDLCSCP